MEESFLLGHLFEKTLRSALMEACVLALELVYWSRIISKTTMNLYEMELFYCLIETNLVQVILLLRKIFENQLLMLMIWFGKTPFQVEMFLT